MAERAAIRWSGAVEQLIKGLYSLSAERYSRRPKSPSSCFAVRHALLPKETSVGVSIACVGTRVCEPKRSGIM